MWCFSRYTAFEFTCKCKSETLWVVLWTGVLTPVNMHDDTAGTSFRDTVVSSIAGLCAGSLLAMVTATMLPAAYERAGRQSVCMPQCLQVRLLCGACRSCLALPTFTELMTAAASRRLWACLRRVVLLH